MWKCTEGSLSVTMQESMEGMITLNFASFSSTANSTDTGGAAAAWMRARIDRMQHMQQTFSTREGCAGSRWEVKQATNIEYRAISGRMPGEQQSPESSKQDPTNDYHSKQCMEMDLRNNRINADIHRNNALLYSRPASQITTCCLQITVRKLNCY